MKSKTSFRLALAVLGQFLVPVIAAPVGTAFTYKGRLTAGGAPVSGSVDLRFRLRDAEVGGAAIGDPLPRGHDTVR